MPDARSRPQHPVDAALNAFAATQPALPLAVCLSGGADSTALLLACARRWPQQVQAWHVHHGLQAAADDFARHCAALCASLDVPLRVRHMHMRAQQRVAPGQSSEDVARRLRYAAFDAWARDSQANGLPVGTVLLAHHADDQAETLLLALTRGAGLPGLSAMPMRWQRAGVPYARPLLDVPGAALRQWLRAQGQDWVQDPSNDDERHTRNRIRARLLPVLDAHFPAFRQTFARSAAHAAQAQQLLAEVAVQDLALCGQPPRIACLQRLSPARQANALRHWLADQPGATPSAAQMAALLRQIAACTTRGHRIQIRVGRGQALRLGDALHWQADAP